MLQQLTLKLVCRIQQSGKTLRFKSAVGSCFLSFLRPFNTQGRVSRSMVGAKHCLSCIKTSLTRVSANHASRNSALIVIVILRKRKLSDPYNHDCDAYDVDFFFFFFYVGVYGNDF